MDSYLYRYGPLESGVLLKRYKRFLADIQLTSGEVITAHCPNTGPMTGVCIPGNPVMVSYSPSKTRKYPYTWELIQLNSEVDPPISKGGLGGLIWTGVNTALPNKIINLALTEKLFPSLGNYSEIRKEVPYGMNLKSRVDFLLKGKDKPIYLEVKNTTWSDGKIALFPDTVTERGQKHLKELIEVVKQGDRAVMLYFINRGDCTEFAPGDTADPVYGQLLREAILVGVEILPCRFEITPEGIKYLGLALPLLR
ncbi:DNA/RNA nuclease SfsA [Planktothrix agardhii]|jgi:sugar fermentation stimulation protein A|uniref:Sugar fermentation stimulation protein homolog n=2 Tax=Planktothrix agardhii TaxID=1160 RepID=A0A1J1JCD5_PLAAG|nr:DNA/RNA nuclease SfsA [Planktothrix agardhii]MCF3606428.1 DNA/RNA nuclease SfsA [Planktothrix agardhii 1033]BBD56330.1 sugar fermentation stimulation protein [Planktothrix agardhii NIES-204]MBG0745029.1 DNA/RNA nuclease SfsA [Planktothrix agardhii KL2]MCB8750564.1 DNA/RNA nuclease SfsA [Planktothrix agardhii 1810]MCF3575054.1 DNA/RNA nuclease SfsA [Planktothrix agardhii 1812]